MSVDGQTLNVRAKNGVVMTLGGFENNPKYQQSFLRRAFWPSLGHAHYNTGDGIGMAQRVGADLWHMASFESNNFEFCDEELGVTWLWGNHLRGILVGENGKRFINEFQLGGAKHGHLAYGGTWQAPALPEKSWQVVDSTIFAEGPLYPSWSPDGAFEIEKGWILKADTLEELAELMGLEGDAAAALPQTVADYNGFCEQGRDWAWDREKDLVPLAEPPYYAVRLMPSIYNTVGGPRKNAKSQVVKPGGVPIPRLYAAGVFSESVAQTYTVFGQNWAEIVNFGRIAGTNAAAEEPLA